MINYDNKKVFSLGKHWLAVIILHLLNTNSVGQKLIRSNLLISTSDTVDVALKSSPPCGFFLRRVTLMFHEMLIIAHALYDEEILLSFHISVILCVLVLSVPNKTQTMDFADSTSLQMLHEMPTRTSHLKPSDLQPIGSNFIVTRHTISVTVLNLISMSL